MSGDIFAMIAVLGPMIVPGLVVPDVPSSLVTVADDVGAFGSTVTVPFSVTVTIVCDVGRGSVCVLVPLTN